MSETAKRPRPVGLIAWLAAGLLPSVYATATLMVFTNRIGTGLGLIDWLSGAAGLAITGLLVVGLFAYALRRGRMAWWLLLVAYAPLVLDCGVRLLIGASSLNIHAAF